MDDVLHGLPFCYTYIDYNLITSTSPEEYLRHLRLMFKWLEAHGIILNMSKSLFDV